MTYKNHNFPKKKVFDRWKSLNPEWDIDFSDDKDCKDFIEKNFGIEYKELFDQIKSGPNKADLWRLCKLYLTGGLYVDIDLIPYKSIDYIIQDSDFCTCLSMDKKSIFQAFLFVREKRNPIIKKCILSLLENKDNYHWEKNEPTFDMYKKMTEMLGENLNSGIYNSNLNISKDLHVKHFICEKEGVNLSKSVNKVKILEEYMDSSLRWQDCRVRFDGIDVMKSRDLEYLESKLSSKTWFDSEILKDKNEMIPKIIYKTGPFKAQDIPVEILNNFQKMLSMNPGFEMVYFDDEQCEQFIKDNFDNKILNAYKSLVPSAYKADLFRYCLLYKSGGVWSDLTQQFYAPISKYVDFEKDELVFVEGKYILEAQMNGIEIAFMASRPKQEIFLKAINKIVENVNFHYYGTTSFCPTGPIMLKKLVKLYNTKYRQDLRVVELLDKDGKQEDYITHKGKLFLKSRSSNHAKLLYHNTCKPHYSELHTDKKIYKNSKKTPLHITWKNEDLSDKQNFLLERWSLLNPNLIIKYYTDETNENFVNMNFPEYEHVINKFDRIVMKLDFIRLLYVYYYGGIYSDFDVLPLKSIEPLLDINEVVICKEDVKNAKNYNVEYILSNAVIIAKPKSNFIKHLIEDIVSNIDSPKINSKNPNDILEMTGPLFFNRAYSSYVDKNRITILDSLYFNPMTFYEISKGEIKNNIEYSYLVHLYDGTWWQQQHDSSIEYLKKMIQIHDGLILQYSNDFQKSFKKYKTNNFIVDMPKVSCLCITKNKEHILRESIISYQNQIYKNKELIVVYEDDNEYINDIIENFNSEDIKYIKISTKNKKTLGELRNISIQRASGEYVCQWDDDDWYHPLRIWEQFKNMKLNNKKGSILSSWTVYDNVKNDLLECKRLNLIGWEGSFLFEKSSLKSLYPDMTRGEDTSFIKNIEKDLHVLYRPELYIYRVHSSNTWGYKNLYDRIIRYSTEYNKVLDFNFLKNKNISTLEGIFGDVFINNKKFDLKSYNKIKGRYDIGIVISTNGNYNYLKTMLDSLNNVSTDKKILLIFLDNSNSLNNESRCLDSQKLLLEYDFRKFNNIKIFKKYHTHIGKDYKTGFDILNNDFDCEYFMSIDSSVRIREDFITKLFEPVIIKNIEKRKYLINGFSKDYYKEDSKITVSTEGYHRFLHYMEDYNLAFNSKYYAEIRSCYNYENYLQKINNIVESNKFLIYSPYSSLLDLLDPKTEDVSYGFFDHFESLKYLSKHYTQKSEIPPIIHRIFLNKNDKWEDLSLVNKELNKNTKGFYKISWNESDVLRLMTNKETDIYTGYIHDIEKCEYAKYVILKYMGGIFLDFGVTINDGFQKFYEKNKSLDILFTDSHESLVSDILMSKPNSENTQKLLDMCSDKKLFKIKDNKNLHEKNRLSIIEKVFEESRDEINFINKIEYNKIFSRKNKRKFKKTSKTNKDLKISVVMQSYLGDYPGSRTEPERKFVRAVNSFLNQTNKNSELIIVSDGCKITEKLYKENFLDNDRIKFKLCENKGQKMYEKSSEMIHYVGEPRQHGVDMSSGDIITYMDSDDILTNLYLEKIIEYWNYNYDLDWIVNRCWWDNVKVVSDEGVSDYEIIFDKQLTKEYKKIDSLESEWVKSCVKKDVVLQSPGLISHKRTCDIKWGNVSSKGNLSEDILFYKEMLEKYKKGKYIHFFGYVRCHLKNGWDF